MSRRAMPASPGGGRHAQHESHSFNTQETLAVRARGSRADGPGSESGPRPGLGIGEGPRAAVGATTTSNPFAIATTVATATTATAATATAATRATSSSSLSGRRLVRDINASLQSMKRIYHDRGIDRDEQDGDHHGGGGGGRERIVISTIDDPSMDDDMVEGLDRESVFVASTAALEEEGDHQHHDRHHRQQTKQRLEKQKPEHHVEEMKKTAGSRSNSVHLQGSMEEGDHDPSSRVAMPVPPSASSSSSSSSSYSSQPASQSSTTSRRSHPQGPLLDPDRPRWTEAGRRAVEELRGISMEKEEGEEEEQGEGEGGKNETTDQSRHATADHAESMTVAKAMKHKAEEKEEGEEEEDKKKEEREGGASVLWSIRASKRAKILHHGRSAYLRSGRNQAMSNVVVPASSSSTMSMAGLATGSGSLAAAAEGRVPGSLWLRDIAQTRQERLAPPRLPNKVAIMDLLDRDMDPMGGFYPSENAALQDMLSWLNDTPLTIPQELEGRAWMLASPVVLKPERIQ